MATITVYAPSMLHAQGFELSAEERASLVAKADRFREIAGTTAKTTINVPVKDPATEGLIGYLQYQL
jgi:hypothetical protein